MSRARRSRRYKYLLGDTPRERARLAFQAKLWDPVSHALFDRIGVGRGWKVLEVGPGQGSLHLELRRRVHAPVDVVERSPVFAARLARLCRRDGLGPVILRGASRVGGAPGSAHRPLGGHRRQWPAGLECGGGSRNELFVSCCHHDRRHSADHCRGE